MSKDALPEDKKTLRAVLAAPEEEMVDTAAFLEALREEDAAAVSPAACLLPGGVRVWVDCVVAREPLDLLETCDGGGPARSHSVAAGTVIRAVSPGPLDAWWVGEIPGPVRGAFPRSRVRELDCDSSEDEESYQGAMGMAPST